MRVQTIAIVLLLCTVALAAERTPNSGGVDDASAALEIGKVVLSRLLTPEDFQKKIFSDAKLKDGVWTVRYWEPKTRINFPIEIQIRQATGSVMRYEDSNS